MRRVSGGVVSMPEHVVQTAHEEMVHCVRYDFYGKRLATCSSDQRIKVWELAPDSDNIPTWRITAEWRAHKGSVWKVEWLDPQFGSVLLSCSFDQSVKVWEEAGEEKDGLKIWIKRAELADSRESLNDVKPAPPHFGLRFATCSDDGQVRIYETMDTMNLAHWSLQSSFESSNGRGSTCISWNPSFFEAAMIVVGKSDGQAVVWHQTGAEKWDVLYTLQGHTDEILNVAWAPNRGRDCNLIATASRDNTVRIWKLPSALTPLDPTASAVARAPKKFEPHAIAVLSHPTPVWQVEWNILGTVLATSIDDGSTFVWRADFMGQWKLVCANWASDNVGSTAATQVSYDDRHFSQSENEHREKEVERPPATISAGLGPMMMMMGSSGLTAFIGGEQSHRTHSGGAGGIPPAVFTPGTSSGSGVMGVGSGGSSFAGSQSNVFQPTNDSETDIGPFGIVDEYKGGDGPEKDKKQHMTPKTTPPPTTAVVSTAPPNGAISVVPLASNLDEKPKHARQASALTLSKKWSTIWK
eukprot:TRINITY_DN4224_c0_g1_i1.p1 TRINITY_DN4224_c0_g1~~TRINITY_DN4224_c0_g1_i1.p1  ORF type:complete len:525 (+),score=64.80 TRINITY_DN4224_c0_g1_i1:115-1689(+)